MVMIRAAIMARVKRDHTGWRSSGIWKKDFTAKPEEARHSSKKNVRKWCKGKVGIKHSYEESFKTIYKNKFKTYKCNKCGKEQLVWDDKKWWGD